MKLSDLRVGMKVVGNDDNRYSTTKKGNGYGIVARIDVGGEFLVKWTGSSGAYDECYVNPKYFDKFYKIDERMKKLKEAML